ncbi:MAG: hypothetical protein JSU86_08130 [Phycisphaerales bacterium]|nr:MAG: hypothetical protein JSU86_08130 [Phycisphaerales bacterium]
MRGFGPIRVLVTRPDRGNHCKFTIGRMPSCLRSFLLPKHRHFAERAWPHSWRLLKAVAVGIEYTIEARRALCHKKKEALLRLPPIRQLIAEITEVVWNEAAQVVVKVSHERPVFRRLEKLMAA